MEQTGDYIAKDSPARALSLVKEHEQKCRMIANSPKLFPLIPRYEQFAFRCCVHTNYLIFYRNEGEQLIILHVLYRAMNYAEILFAQ